MRYSKRKIHSSVFIVHQVGSAGTAGDPSCPALMPVATQPESNYSRVLKNEGVSSEMFHVQ